MPLPELTSTGKENGSAPTDASSKKRRADTVRNASSAPAPPAATTAATTAAGAAMAGDEDEGVYWKRQFLQLRKLRETDPEAKLDEAKERSEKRERALKNYTLEVEKQLAEAKAELKASNAEAAASTSSSTSSSGKEVDTTASDMEKQISELSTTVRLQQHVIGHYKLLTSLKLSNITPKSRDVTIHNVKNGTEARIRLTSIGSEAAGGNGEMLRLDPLVGKEYLPEYMRKPIEFEAASCPALIREVLCEMFPDEE